jgi:predicted nuclease of restriction endonuclease-like (RecB) superfamily
MEFGAGNVQNSSLRIEIGAYTSYKGWACESLWRPIDFRMGLHDEKNIFFNTKCVKKGLRDNFFEKKKLEWFTIKARFMEIILADIRTIIAQSRERAARSVHQELTVMYWLIGRRIIHEESDGKERATYGTALIQKLATQLTTEYGENFSKRNLLLGRQLHIVFPNVNTLYSQLSWSHYKVLIRVDDPLKRDFYIAEATKNAWAVREMERQMNSLLYERLLVSQDQASVMAIAKGDAIPTKPHHIIKDPTILEFLDLKPQAAYYEKDIENALITHLFDFLLELGDGFSFVARQKRIYLDGDEFRIDLVFYNRFLQCFVLFDLKIDKITHQDLGQIQMYVNYYDRNIKQPYENPTIGVLLCADKNDMVVKYSLPEGNTQIFASKYQFHLPTPEQLVSELRKELDKLSDKENSDS